MYEAERLPPSVRRHREKDLGPAQGLPSEIGGVREHRCERLGRGTSRRWRKGHCTGAGSRDVPDTLGHECWLPTFTDTERPEVRVLVALEGALERYRKVEAHGET